MPEFLSAGVFVEEIASGQTAILGVSTSTFASVGFTPRGPEDKAVLVTSLPDFLRKFGGYWSKSDSGLAMTAYFKNGGSRAYFIRVTPSDAVKATSNGANFDLTATSKGTWANNFRVVLVGNASSFDYSNASYSRFDALVQENIGGAFVTVETFSDLSLDDVEDVDFFPEVLNDEINGSDYVRVAVDTTNGAAIPASFAATLYEDEAVATGNGTLSTFTKTLAHPAVAPFSLKISIDGVVEVTDNGRGKLVLAPTADSLSAVSGTINYVTGAIVLNAMAAPATGALITASYYKKGADSFVMALSGGNDGSSVSRAQMTDPGLQGEGKGLYALDKVDEILNLAIADFRGNVAITQDLLDYAAFRKDAMVIVDAPAGSDAQDAKNHKLVTLGSQSSHGAMYWPGIKIADPLKNDRPRVISNVGHVAGRYAFTDNARNVSVAPAGMINGQLQFALGLEQEVTKGDMDLVYPANVNPLLANSTVGKVIWGARTLASSGDFQLVPHRRLFNYLEKSIFIQTHDLVFEPIGADLFSQVKLRLDGFLTNLAGDGYFASRVPAEAFRVVCDETNNTASTSQARQLIVDILIAPSSPAEFIRLRFRPQFSPLA